ncbi:MAG: hypothetical protein AAF799_48160 [Myxococcota bacterium]
MADLAFLVAWIGTENVATTDAADAETEASEASGRNDHPGDADGADRWPTVIGLLGGSRWRNVRAWLGFISRSRARFGLGRRWFVQLLEGRGQSLEHGFAHPRVDAWTLNALEHLRFLPRAPGLDVDAVDRGLIVDPGERDHDRWSGRFLGHTDVVNTFEGSDSIFANVRCGLLGSGGILMPKERCGVDLQCHLLRACRESQSGGKERRDHGCPRSSWRSQ